MPWPPKIQPADGRMPDGELLSPPSVQLIGLPVPRMSQLAPAPAAVPNSITFWVGLLPLPSVVPIWPLKLRWSVACQSASSVR